MSDFFTALRAMDRLNSWVRSPSYHHGILATAHHVVYWLKGEALMEATRRGWATHRLVGTYLKCRDCGGDGRFKPPWSSGEYSWCRRCDSKGIAHLRFIESSIDEISWHTPVDYRTPAFAPGWYEWTEHRIEDDWAPNREGRDLEPDEAACLLNVVETYIPHGRYPNRYFHDIDEEYNDFTSYGLWIGEDDLTACALCKSPAMAKYARAGRYGRVQWTFRLCEACEAADNHGRVSRTLIPPRALLNQPNIAEWIRRHSTLQTRIDFPK